MTRQHAQKMLPLIAAYAEGKEIQWRFDSKGSVWETLRCPEFAEDGEYRIKPDKKYRPWKPEEVPMFALYRLADGSIVIPLRLSSDGRLWFLDVNGQATYNELEIGVFQHMEYSKDWAKTWHKCGVYE